MLVQWLGLLLLFSCFFTDASAEPKAVIWTKANPDRVEKMFRKGTVTVIDSTREREKLAAEEWDPRRRDALFDKVGLAEMVKDWDQLDRDLLIVNVGEHSLQELSPLYPQFSSETLQVLKREISGEKSR